MPKGAAFFSFLNAGDIIKDKSSYITNNHPEST